MFFGYPKYIINLLFSEVGLFNLWSMISKVIYVLPLSAQVLRIKSRKFSALTETFSKLLYKKNLEIVCQNWQMKCDHTINNFIDI